MTLLFGLAFLLPIGLVPLLCAWLYCRTKSINQTQSYLLNGILMFLLPFVWKLFQDPVEIQNSIPVFHTASLFFLGNLVFGIPTSLINQIFMNFLLSRRRESETKKVE